MFIYFVTNLINGRRYVGQTCGPVGYRWAAHIYEARYKSKPCCPVFHRAIIKYGPDSFKIEWINVSGHTQEQVDFLERWFIDELRTLKPNGYNIEPGGKGGRHSEETKRKIGESHRGMKRSPQARENMSAWQRGIKRSPRHVEAIRQAVTGRKHRPETKLKQSLAKKGMPSPLRGRKNGPLSEETKAKLSASAKLRKIPAEQRQRAAVKMRARWQDRAYRERVLAARVGRHRISEAGIEKLRESKKVYWRRVREAQVNGG